MNQVDFINVMNLELIDLKSRSIIGKVNMFYLSMSFKHSTSMILWLP